MYESVAQGFEYSLIRLNNALRQVSDYAWSTFHMVLNKPLILNMLGLIQSCESARVRQGAKYG